MTKNEKKKNREETKRKRIEKKQKKNREETKKE